MDVGEIWSRRKHGRVVYTDTDEHVALIVRTLGIETAVWQATLDAYAERLERDAGVATRLRTLTESFVQAACLPALPSTPPTNCACCGAATTRAVVERPGPTPLVFGRCDDCGHGQLLSEARSNPYESANYYRQRAEDGSGYAAYAAERDYREAKALQLFDSLAMGGLRPTNLLEVGSGFGFSRRAAERRGIRSAGVDVNPEAARAARELYGFDTQVSTLRDALTRGALPRHAFDLVLYWFVLEHIADPLDELQQAAAALSPGGHLVLVVPSMSALELDVFRGRYRSLRGDHLHLFSPASLERFLGAAGLTLVELRSHCNLHLLRGFLDADELSAIYARGRGPDLTVVAKGPSR